MTKLKLKRYLVTVVHYPNIFTQDIYDDVFDVWAFDKHHAELLVNKYYCVYKNSIEIKVYKCIISTLWYKLINKVPKEPICIHV